MPDKLFSSSYLKIERANKHIDELKSGKVKGVRFSTIEKTCQYLHGQPGDLLEYRDDDED